MKNPQVNALIKTPATPFRTRIIAGAAIVLLNLNMAMAQEPATPGQQAPAQTQQEPAPAPQPDASSTPQEPTATPQQQTAAPQATGTFQTGPQVPFNAVLHKSRQSLRSVSRQDGSTASLANSPRLGSLIRDGKLYLSFAMRSISHLKTISIS